jgi:hypothetical protein
VEQIWAIWPKKIDTLVAMRAIGEAIHRHGFERVDQGTRAIVAADAARHAMPPGRYLPRPAEFFEGGRYLDDPGQYGARTAAVVPLGMRVRELARQLDEHDGSPLKAGEPDPDQAQDGWKLFRELQGLRKELLDAETEPLPVRIREGAALLEFHVGNPESIFGGGCAEVKMNAEPEFLELRKKWKALRDRVRESTNPSLQRSTSEVR